MKDRTGAILKARQEEYLVSLLPERDSLLQTMEEFAEKNGHPIADPEVAQMMRILVRAAAPRRILEIGTNIGYSVIVMAREAPSKATVDTIERDPSILATAREFVARAKLKPEIVFHEGAALDVLPHLEGPFDFVFIDCVKTEYEAYLDEVLPKLEEGALIVCDNLLWKGQVAEEPRSTSQEASTMALRRFNQRITSDPRLLSTILPVGDGLGVSRYQP